MVDKMMKYSFILLNGETEGFLEKIQEMGVVDITRSAKPVDEKSAGMLDSVSAAKKIIGRLESMNYEKDPDFEKISKAYDQAPAPADAIREAQQALGKTVGYEGQATLLMMRDSYGLSTEVILMAVEYAVAMKKTGFAYIGRIGKKWSEEEIDTIEAAEQYILEHNEVNEVWNKLRSLTQINNINPTEKQHRYLNCWVKEYGYDVNIIYQAYEESVNNTGKLNMPYMDKIIKNWYDRGVKTPHWHNHYELLLFDFIEMLFL